MSTDCFAASDTDHTPERLAKLRRIPMEDKVHYSLAKIKEFYVREKGQVYVSFSGGKDSTVLLDLVRSVYPDVPAVYADTGLEYPEIREFAMATPNTVAVRPDMSFRRVIETKGYPVIGKEVSHWVDLARRGQSSGIRQMALDTRHGCARYAYLMDAPFRISRDCCDVLKKRPMHRYERETGRKAFVGTRTDESQLRATSWFEYGDVTERNCTPLSIWTEEDVWRYIRTRDLAYCPIYDVPGIERTGCVFCMFGITHDRDRFLLLKRTHPKLWEYCMREWDEGGLGMRGVLDWLGIPTGCGQTDLTRWTEADE